MNESAAGTAAPTVALNYEGYYRFAHAPFAYAPDPSFYFASHPHERVLRDTLATLNERRSVLVTGGDGTGKTTLARLLPQKIDRTTVASLHLGPFVSLDDLLQGVLVDFGISSTRDGAVAQATRIHRSALVKALQDFLVSLSPLGAHAVLILDQAHQMDDETLATLGSLSTGAPDTSLQLVLLGDDSLAAKAEGQHALARLKPAIAPLEPLGRQDCEDYIWHRITRGQGETAVYFDAGAMDEIAFATQGVPLDINRLCERALDLAARARMHEIGPDLVRTAVRLLGLREPELAPRPHARRSWALATVVTVAAALGFLLAAPVADWIPTPLPPLPHVPRVASPVPAEARPIPTLPDELTPTPATLGL